MKKILLILTLIISCAQVFSQDLLKQDLRTVKVDELTDAQIINYYNRLQQSNITLEQAERIAASKGMPQQEIDKLHQRISQLIMGAPSNGNNNNNTGDYLTDTAPSQRKTQLYYVPVQKQEADSNIFGSQLFSNISLTFEPNLRIATPVNYQLGPDDQLLIDVFGYSEAHYQLTVSPEGNIYIPNVGPVYVNGLTIEDATIKIKNKLASTIYRAINTGKTRVQVSLGNIKSVNVTVVGEAKKPGTYTVSSLSTVFNALYLAGGPNINGSYRNIQLIRGNKVIDSIDLYRFLLEGKQEGNVGLMNQDVIRIPFYKMRVTLKGEVKRPAIYELKPGDNLQDIINYAGGFTDSAYRSSVKITSLTDKERRVEDVESENYSTYQLQSSDIVTVGKILDRYANRVTLEGAVMRPGDYELTQGLTLKQLILKADGLREDAFLERGLITRLNEDMTMQSVPFGVSAILNGREQDIPLKREDVVNISSIFDLRDSFEITVQGEVRFPGTYSYKDSLTVKDLVYEAGGFTEAATGMRIEVARRVLNGDVSSSSTEIAKIIQVNTEKDLQLTNNQYYLQPFDLVTIRTNPGYFTQKTVMVQGEVMYPGPYAISSIDEKISDLVRRAGGFKSTADASAASLRRLNIPDVQTEIKTRKVEKLINQEADTSYLKNEDSLRAEAVTPYDLIGINLQEVMQKPGITNDLILENGDVLFVPKRNQAIKVRGEVLFPTQFSFREGKNMKYYIDKAGGFSSIALKRKSFVLGSNGNARKVHSFLFFKSYPEIKAGDEIFVPKEPMRRGRLTTGEVVGITSAVVSLASVIIALINNLR